METSLNKRISLSSTHTELFMVLMFKELCWSVVVPYGTINHAPASLTSNAAYNISYYMYMLQICESEWFSCHILFADRQQLCTLFLKLQIILNFRLKNTKIEGFVVHVPVIL